MIESVPFKFVYEQNKYSLFAQNHFLVKFIFYLLSQSSLKVVEFFLTVFLTEFPSFAHLDTIKNKRNYKTSLLLMIQRKEISGQKKAEDKEVTSKKLETSVCFKHSHSKLSFLLIVLDLSLLN